jgi:hypothetical protein
MTLRELGKVLYPYANIRIEDFASGATLSETTWYAIEHDISDLHPCVLDREVVSVQPDYVADGYDSVPGICICVKDGEDE